MDVIKYEMRSEFMESQAINRTWSDAGKEVNGA